ncbi:ATP-dependent metalloprotease FtsH [Thermobaculum terrenum ATCC BAA-798]|uniref:ATP-dependent zinc metalloprotease FtsH n=1 Tax=Thermobaculum terrenum (strain ATCC BAA-798 / CCMEE 7001 / YNP1) TaxID=525904 RepID=D1CGB2_THET1|nr:ATP-dependent zinc metalloprotease FtsH [Thermobaculum terrenum]ACZ41968.1 ATP-dependent metalloprotease FtsH [Thermobaculum terrenum ATCC BAA-798]
MNDRKLWRNSLVWLVAAVVLLTVWMTLFSNRQSRIPEVPITEVIQDAKAGKIESIQGQVDSSDIVVRYNDGEIKRSRTQIPIQEALDRSGVDESNIKIDIKPASSWSNWLGVLSFILPTLFLIGVFLFFMRQAQGTNNQALSFGKSRARLFNGNKPTVKFDDVAGVQEAKEELAEIVEFLKYPEKFAALGARIPRGVLLVGPPGTGKTLLSRAVAGEAGVPFFSISGSEFVEMFVGVGASRVRDLFDQAKRNAPCIVFIDEIDAVGRQRGAGLGGSHDEREQTLNQILVEMDGFDTNTNVIVIAATNRPDVLDPALLRPGRFDRQVVLDRPDIRGREAILRVHTRGKPIDKDVSLHALAKQTTGFSGADLENTVNEAAILAARRNHKVITRQDFEDAIDRVVAGPERKSRIITEREKWVTAYHEAGHALVARMLPNMDPVHKITIVARGMAGGYTRVLPTEDRHLMTKSQFEDTLAFAMGGRVAEELIFHEISTGAENDIQQATNIARKMVTEYGMSEKLGPVALGHKEELIFLGREISEQRNYSDEIALQIDQEIRKLIDNAYQRAKQILTENMDKLIALASLLVEKETLDNEDMESLFDTPRPQPKVVPIPQLGGKTKEVKPQEDDKLKGLPDLSGGLAPA